MDYFPHIHALTSRRFPIHSRYQNNITTQINSNPNHRFLSCGDYNHDIALIGRTHDNHITPPQPEEPQWQHFTNSLNFTYIPIDTNYSRQGGLDYMPH